MFLIAILTLFALLLARVVGAPQGAWRPILAAAGLVVLGGQFLAPGHPLRVDLVATARLAFWLGLAAIPVGIYAVFLRRLRRRTGADRLNDAAPRRVGLVRIDDDRRLAADTRAALEDETPGGGTLSLAWRDPDGALVGHIRLRRFADAAEVEAIRVAPERRGDGIGGRLLSAAERELRADGVNRISAAAGDWQSPEFFTHAGYRAEGSDDLGGGRSRLRLGKDLA
jgi:GNAT superfamily N-acetyltransferase